MRAIALGVFLLIGGCASVQPVAVTMHAPEHKLERNYQVGAEQSVYVGQPMVRVKDYYVQQSDTQVVRPDRAFTIKFPPIYMAAGVAKDTPMAVVGTSQKDGHTFRLVQLPPESAVVPLRFLITDDGVFEGSALNAYGARMGWTYKPQPADVRLVGGAASNVVASKGFTNFELVYGGMDGDSMQVMYREYTPDDMARPAFSQQLVYTLASKSIRFRDIQIKVAGANNEKITYTVVSDGNP